MSVIPSPKVLEKMLNQVSDLIFLISPDFKFMFANHAYINYMKLPPKKITKKSINDVIPAEYIPMLKKKFNNLSINKTSFDNIYPSLLDDGSIIIEKWHNEGIFDENGTLLYYYCIGNIKKQTKQQLLNSETDLVSNTLIKFTMIGIIISIENEITYINKRSYSILGLPEKGFEYPLNIRDFFESIAPNYTNQILLDKENSDTTINEIQFSHPQKGIIWLSVIRKTQKFNGKETELFILEDITERKNNELETVNTRKRLDEVMRVAKIGYWEKDFENDCWIWSNEIYRIYGIPHETPIFDKTIRSYIAPVMVSKRKKRSALSYKQKRFSFYFEYKILTADGSIKWLSGEAFRKDGRFYGWLQDITERKNIEKALLKAKTKAEESERLKSIFLANMSHEIRTPLNAILGFSDLLTSTKNPAEKENYKKIIHDSSNILLKIIDDILNFSLIESGKLELYPETLTVKEILSNISNIYQKHKQDRVKLNIQSCEENIPITVDRERLVQVFINLIDNSFKYTERGSINVEYKLDKDHVIFSVVDTGKGIPNNAIGQIFDRFYQADAFSKGTGLGLSISRSIIRQMKGEFTVESEPGKGSKFSFTLPLKKQIAA